MIPVGKRRRKNSDLDSIQMNYKPDDDHETMQFGCVPYGKFDSNCIFSVLSSNDFMPPDDFFLGIDVYKLKYPYKA
jgi:hypothetical protein